jgi:prepilin-type processing-associated H-X9-DG protein
VKSKLVYAFNVEEMFPDYFSDPAVLLCPSDLGADADDLINPVSGVMDYGFRCEATCRGWNAGHLSYGYVGYTLDKVSKMKADAGAMKTVDPEAWTLLINFWDAINNVSNGTTWTSPAGTKPVKPLSIQFSAWQQILFINISGFLAASTFLEALPVTLSGPTLFDEIDQAGFDLLTGGFAVGPPNAVVQVSAPGSTASYAAKCNDVTLAHPSTGRSDLDWSAFAVSEGYDQFVGTGDTHFIFPVAENVGRYLITDINSPGGNAAADSSVIVMWDQTSTIPAGFNHVPGGSNALYLDGHVSFLKYEPDNADADNVAGVTSTAAVWSTALLQNFVGADIGASTAPDCQ